MGDLDVVEDKKGESATKVYIFCFSYMYKIV